MPKFLTLIMALGIWLPFASEAQIPARVEVPAKWTEKIGQHLVQIEQKNWGKLEAGELYHAHLILRTGARSRFASVDELFQNSALMLYHSDEQLRQWLGVDGALPIAKRTPRSVVGYWNGQVVPAVELVSGSTQTWHYSSAGTIHPDDLAGQQPRQLALWSAREVALTLETSCRVNLIVDISRVYDARSRPNLLIGDRKFMITMECT